MYYHAEKRYVIEFDSISRFFAKREKNIRACLEQKFEYVINFLLEIVAKTVLHEIDDFGMIPSPKTRLKDISKCELSTASGVLGISVIRHNIHCLRG